MSSTVENEQVTKVEVVKSDRVDLMEHACTFINLMVFKQTAAMRRESFETPDLTELSNTETKTYHSALALLGREFDKGANPISQHATEWSTKAKIGNES